MRTIRRLLGDRKAATAVEYGLILSLIVIAIIGGLSMFASTTIGMWNNVSTAVVTVCAAWPAAPVTVDTAVDAVEPAVSTTFVTGSLAVGWDAGVVGVGCVGAGCSAGVGVGVSVGAGAAVVVAAGRSGAAVDVVCA